MIRTLATYAAPLILLLGCGSSEDESFVPPQDGVITQGVNNTAALEHIDARMKSMSDTEKLSYLTLHSCASQIAMIGVYGSVEDNPLMQRWNELNQRYNDIWYESKAELVEEGVAPNLTYAEDDFCPGDTPVG